MCFHLLNCAKIFICLNETFILALRLDSGSDSLSIKYIKTSVVNEMIHHNTAVARYHQDEASESPHRAGPIISEKPNTAPFIPKTFVRSSGLLISASIACATDILPHVIPSKTLEINMINIGKEITQI